MGDTAGVDDEGDAALELGGMTLREDEELELGVGVEVGVTTSLDVKVWVEVLVDVNVLVRVLVMEIVDPGRVETPPPPVQVSPLGQQPIPSQ